MTHEEQQFRIAELESTVEQMKDAIRSYSGVLSEKEHDLGDALRERDKFRAQLTIKEAEVQELIQRCERFQSRIDKLEANGGPDMD